MIAFVKEVVCCYVPKKEADELKNYICFISLFQNIVTVSLPAELYVKISSEHTNECQSNL